MNTLFRNCIFRVQIQMISSLSEANPKCTQQLSCTRIHVKKISQGQASVDVSFCQKWPLSTYIHCRLGRCKRPLETFNRLFTLLRVIPEQRRVDVFSSYWTDGYDQDVWQVVKIHMKLKKSCVDQTLMKVFPKSVFVLLPGIQDVENLPINDDMPFYFHVRVFVPANCVSFSVPEMNFWQCICFVRSVAVQWKMFVENIYTEVTENFLSCVFFFTVFF